MPCFLYSRLWLADFMITLATVRKHQSIISLLYNFAIMASFVIFNELTSDNTKACKLVTVNIFNSFKYRLITGPTGLAY